MIEHDRTVERAFIPNISQVAFLRGVQAADAARAGVPRVRSEDVLPLSEATPGDPKSRHKARTNSAPVSPRCSKFLGWGEVGFGHGGKRVSTWVCGFGEVLLEVAG